MNILTLETLQNLVFDFFENFDVCVSGLHRFIEAFFKILPFICHYHVEQILAQTFKGYVKVDDCNMIGEVNIVVGFWKIWY